MATARTAAIASLVVGAFLACAVVFVQAQVVVFALLGAIVIAEALRPVVDALSARVPRGAAIVIAFASVLLACGILWFVSLRALAPQVGAFLASLSGTVASLGPLLPSSAEPTLLKTALSVEAAAAEDVSTIGLAVVLALFWFGASDKFRSAALLCVPAQERPSLDAVFGELSGRLRLYVVGSVVNGAIVGIACALGLSWLRFPFPLALGVLEGLLVAIPYIGPFAGVLIAAAVAFAEHGPLGGAEAVAIVSLANTLEGTFVSPLIFQRRLDLDPLTVLLATAIGGTLFGIAGIVLAVPCTAIAQTIILRVAIPAIRSRPKASWRAAAPPSG